MNLFAVDRDAVVAARSLCDKHVVRMTLETAQILSTVSWLLGRPAPYKPTHVRHPCVLWTAERLANWEWVVAHGLGLADEFERRFGGLHRSREVIEWVRKRGAPPRVLGRRLPFVQAMPEEYRGGSAVAAYRRFYVGEKARFASWRAPSSAPAWFLEGVRIAKMPAARLRGPLADEMGKRSFER